MTKRAVTPYQAPRVIHYVQPNTTPQTGMMLYAAAHIVAQRHERELAYAKWAVRQAAIAERDRRTRRILLRVAAVVAMVVVTGLAVLGWMAYHAITTATAHASDVGWVGGVVLAGLVLTGLVVGGHRCITIIEHRH